MPGHRRPRRLPRCRPKPELKLDASRPKRASSSTAAIVGRHGLRRLARRPALRPRPRDRQAALEATRPATRSSRRPVVLAGRWRTVYFGDETGKLHAVDAATGKARWIFTADGRDHLLGQLRAGDCILFGSYDNRLYCLRPESGKAVWKVETDGYVHGTPAIAGGDTLVAGCDGFLRRGAPGRRQGGRDRSSSAATPRRARRSPAAAPSSAPSRTRSWRSTSRRARSPGATSTRCASSRSTPRRRSRRGDGSLEDGAWSSSAAATRWSTPSTPPTAPSAGPGPPARAVDASPVVAGGRVLAATTGRGARRARPRDRRAVVALRRRRPVRRLAGGRRRPAGDRRRGRHPLLFRLGAQPRGREPRTSHREPTTRRRARTTTRERPHEPYRHRDPRTARRRPLPEPATAGQSSEDTEVGSVFVSNYPPYSAWSPEAVAAVERRLAAPAPDPATPLGLYLHIPFCRKRCKFCYFRVYTDKNSGEIGRYLDALAREVELWRRAARDRRPAAPLRLLRRRHAVLHQRPPARGAVRPRARRVLLGPAPRRSPSSASRGPSPSPSSRRSASIGVTRLSLGIESFDDEILRENGRAHVSTEIYRVPAVDPRARLRPAQRRPDRRHGRRDLGDLEGDRRADARGRARQRHRLSDGAAVQRPSTRRTSWPGASSARSPPGPTSAPGTTRPSSASRRPATRCRAPTPW